MSAAVCDFDGPVEHLDRDEYPATLGLLQALLAGRTDYGRLGYRPNASGFTVDWDHLANEAPISSTEVAMVHIAHGCAILERHGGLSRLAQEAVDAVAEAARPLVTMNVGDEITKGDRVRFTTTLGLQRQLDSSGYEGTVTAGVTGTYLGPHPLPRMEGWHLVSVNVGYETLYCACWPTHFEAVDA